MNQIPLRNKNKEIIAYATVDDVDYERVIKFKWHLDAWGYAVHRIYLGKNDEGKYKFKVLSMHRLIKPISDTRQIDHINGDKLDNRNNNLRICTGQENSWNMPIYKNNISGYKGVSFKKDLKYRKWMARIQKEGQYVYLGLHHTKDQAARAYNEAAKKYFGEFARLNQL